MNRSAYILFYFTIEILNCSFSVIKRLTTLVPRRGIRLVLNLKSLNIYAYTDMIRFVSANLRIFRVILACSSSLTYFDREILESILAKSALKCNLNVCIAL